MIVSPANAVWVVALGGPRETCIRWGPDPPCKGTILRGKVAAYRKAQELSAVSCAKNG